MVSFTVISKEGMSKGQFWAKSQMRWKSFIVTSDGPLGKLQNATNDERNSKTRQKKSLFLDQVKTLLKRHIWAACIPLHFSGRQDSDLKIVRETDGICFMANIKSEQTYSYIATTVLEIMSVAT